VIPGLLKRVRLFRARPSRAAAPGRSRARTRGRAELACGLLAALAATVGMSAAVETVRPEWRDPEFGHRLRRLEQVRRESPGRPLVLVLGTSRTQNAIHPAAMGFADEPGSPRAFNFGQSASPALKVLLTLERVLDAGVRPSAVVVEALPVWLVADGPAEKQFAETVTRLSAADLRHLASYCDDPAALRAKWLAARVAPWHEQRVVLMSHWLARWLPGRERLDFQWNATDADGFTPFPYEEPRPDIREAATEHARREYAGAFEWFRPGAVSVRALRDLVARCRAEGIPVAFAVPPVSPAFRGWFRPDVWAAADAELRSLARELGVELFPAFDGFAEEDFADGHHLLRGGAERYSRWLADTHLKPWLARQGVPR
jgi:hypothetical protein